MPPSESANDVMHELIYAVLTEGGILVSVSAFLEWMGGKNRPV